MDQNEWTRMNEKYEKYEKNEKYEKTEKVAVIYHFRQKSSGCCVYVDALYPIAS